MNNKLRLVSAIYNEFYPFHNYSKSHLTSVNPDHLTINDVLLVWGGADISPSLYNKKPYPGAYANDRPSQRDIIEWGMMKQAKKLGIPIIGICRGAQMLCALAGGFLIQDTTDHAGSSHPVVTLDGLEFETNTIHHQMMYPFDVEHVMLAKSKEKLSKVYVDEDEYIDIPEEPELVYFPKVKGMAIQWHPEGMRSDSAATQYIYKQLNERMGL